MNNISSILESDKPQPPKLTNTKIYQLIPLSSTLVKTVRRSKIQVENSSINELKVQPPSIKTDQIKNQFPSSSMLQAYNIKTTLVENYGKLRKQLKKQNLVNCNEYKVKVVKPEVKLYNIEGILLNELSKLEKLIFMGNNTLNKVLETNCDTNKYNDITLNLKYIKQNL